MKQTTRLLSLGLALSCALQGVAQAAHTVLVTDANGNRVSQLTSIVDAPTFISQPPSVQVSRLGGYIGISVSVAGTLPLTYQWYRNTTGLPGGGVAIAGATSNTLLISNATATSFTDPYSGANSYYVVITNGSGTVTSKTYAVYTDSNNSGVPDWQRLPYTLATTPLISASQYPSDLKKIALQADGKFLVAGDFRTLSGRPQNCLGRLNANGTNDLTFQAGCQFETIKDVIVQSGGKILVAGDLLVGTTPVKLLRLNANGTVDTTFTNGYDDAITCLALQSDGKVLLGGLFGIKRLTTTGALDPTFNPGTNLAMASVIEPNCIQIDSTGRIYVGGQFLTYNGVSSPGIVRILATGARDTTFKVGKGIENYGAVKAVLVNPAGGVFVGGTFTKVNGKAVTGVVSLTSTGAVDLSTLGKALIAQTAQNSVISLVFQPDGDLLVGGYSYYHQEISRYKMNGTITTYYPSINGTVQCLAPQPNGQLLVGGQFYDNGAAAPSLYRLNMDGTDDGTVMNARGVGSVYDFVEQADGKVLVKGTFDSLANVKTEYLGRLNADGSVDEGFRFPPNSINYYSDVLSLPDGKVLVLDYNGFLARFNVDGSRDLSFQATGTTYIGSLALQPDGKIIASTQSGLVRLMPDGSQDPSYDIICQGVTKMVVQPDGKLLMVGYFGTINGVSKPFIARLLPNGSIDSTFNPPLADGLVRTVALAPNGQVYVGGDFTLMDSASRPKLALLNANGSLDSFAIAPSPLPVVQIKPTPEGSLFVATETGVAKYFANGVQDPTFGLAYSDRVRALLPRTNGDLYIGGDLEATDVVGLARYTSSPTLNLGQVAITPTGVVAPGTALTLTASATANSGTVASVTFQYSIDGVDFTSVVAGKKSTATTWTAKWTPPTEGVYYLRTAAKGSLGQSAVSIPVQHREAQTITFGNIAGKKYGDAPFQLVGSATSGLPVSFTIVSGPGYVDNDSKVSIFGVGSVVIRADQYGNGQYAPAAPVTRTVTIAKAPQTITFAALGDKVQNSAPFRVTATSSSNLAVTLTGTGKASISDMNLVILASGIGAASITASQAGDDNYLPATAVTRAFQVIAPTTFAQWQTKNGISGSAMATSYGDGVPILLKYLANINPTRPMTAADRAALPTMDVESSYGPDYLTLTYRKYALSTGLTQNVQSSYTLGSSWNTVPPEDIQEIGVDPVTGDPIMRARVYVAGYRYHFIRLNVTATLSGQGSLSYSTIPEGYHSLEVDSTYSGTAGTTYASLPLNPTPFYTGAVSTVADKIIIVADNPAPWIAGDLATAARPCFVKFLTGAQAGRLVKVTANTTNSLTLDTTDNSTQTVTLKTAGFSVAAGDTFEVFDGFTLASVFGTNTTDNPLVFAGGTTATADTVGLYKVSTATWQSYYFDLTAGYWKSTTSSANANNTVVYPYTAFKVTRKGNRDGIICAFTGRVAEVARLVKTTGSGVQIYDSTGYAMGLPLYYSEPVGTWLRGNTAATANTFEVYNPETLQLDTYFKTPNSYWLKSGDTGSEFSFFYLEAGAGFGIRQRATVSGAASFLKLPLPYSLE